MPYWTAFAGFAGVVLVLLLFLARLSYQSGDGRPADGVASTDSVDTTPDSVGTSTDSDEVSTAHSGATTTTDEFSVTDSADSTDSADATVDVPGRFAVDFTGRSRRVDAGGSNTEADADDELGVQFGAHGDSSQHRHRRGGIGEYDVTTAELLVNVVITQGAFAVLLAAGAWYARIPLAAFGLGRSDLTLATLGTGIVLGLVLSVLNQFGTAASDRLGLGNGDELRQLLTPESPLGWVALLVVVLPIIAGFEELLFRGALIGVISVGFGVSPWFVAVLSSVAFALGHGAQGPSGIVVTGALGFVLAAAFVLTGSLLVVVVAHYLVNALEFAVHGISDAAR